MIKSQFFPQKDVLLVVWYLQSDVCWIVLAGWSSIWRVGLGRRGADAAYFPEKSIPAERRCQRSLANFCISI